MFAFVPLFKFRPFLENFISIRTATYPGNTMIKRMQSNGAGGKPKVYSGAIDCLRQILQKEGVGGATLFAPFGNVERRRFISRGPFEKQKPTLLALGQSFSHCESSISEW